RKAQAEKEAAEKDAAKKAGKEAADKKEKNKKEKKKKGEKPVRHTGKNNGRGESTAPAPAAAADAPRLNSQPAATGVEGVAASSPVPAGVDFNAAKGKLPFPVQGRYTIVKRFGRQKHPTLPHVETNNSGIDIAADRGAAVRAVFDGEVSAVFRPDGYNNVIVLRHGRYMTVYANLGSISVATGQKVKAGQTLGTLFADPGAPDARSVLHFEIRNQRQKENPETWLRH
ncbi:MAG: M23 family metallopeptidase, partial [Muribaculaceae bacterium]|nr:M23 family metallopeptidase [Muribaculaceae bacterium]